ncbi:MAG: Uma2 family endonuclease [Leptolyngbya sp. SIO1E4]|nr:Uma2 family endonuclease [Leptolyngbya sp. SIO1E4]
MVRLDATPPQTPDLEAPQHAAEANPLDVVSCPPPGLYSDEPPLETDLHRDQIDLLIRLLKYWWRDRNDFYISGNLTVYYSAEETKKRDFRGPDVFVVLDTEKRDRRSWVIWEEGGKYPNIVIELLSDSTAAVDRGRKKELYQNVWRLPEYYWFHPETLEFAGFRLIRGQYEAISPDKNGRFSSEELGLALGIYERQLRWFTADGALVPLPEETERQAREQAEQQAAQAQQAREQAEQQAAQAQQEKEREQQRIERLEAYLRSQGIDPEQLP